jgi:hypothetical protein
MVKPTQDVGGNPVFTSARAFEEYVNMFALSERDLAQPILDCAAGAASFTAEACDASLDVTAVDTLYDRPWVEVEAAVHAGIRTAVGNVEAQPERYDWSWMGRTGRHAALRQSAALRFLEDLRQHPDRYVAGRLPTLPFASQKFGLVTCSHLLFTYTDLLDEEFHIAAIREMLRVATVEVRVFPTIGFRADASEVLTKVRDVLSGDGYEVRLESVTYRFQRGATKMLRVIRS